MKKLIAILLIPVFLLMATGVAITSLYCKGKISEVGVKVTPCCEDVNKGGCCNTETQVVKIDSDYLSPSSKIEFPKIIDLSIPYLPSATVVKFVHSQNNIIHWDKAPPLLSTELYILFRSLII